MKKYLTLHKIEVKISSGRQTSARTLNNSTKGLYISSYSSLRGIQNIYKYVYCPHASYDLFQADTTYILLKKSHGSLTVQRSSSAIDKTDV